MSRETKTVVVLRCDLHGGAEVVAEETVSFAAGGITYEMELCAEHLGAFNATIESWTANARPVAGRRRRGGAEGTDPAGGGTPNGEGIDRAAVRQWARANGYEQSDRGRLAQSVVDAFLAAQSQSPVRG